MELQSTTVARLLLLVTLSVLAAGCEAIGFVFKAGLFSGIIAVVLIVIVVGFLFTKLRR